MLQLQRISDGVVFDVLGTKISGRGQLNPDGSGAKHPAGDIVWLRYAEGTYLHAEYGDKSFGHGNDSLRNNFTAYPPQGKKPVGGQLMRSDGRGDGALFDVVAVGPNFVRIQADREGYSGISLTREYVQTFFTAYPPQPKPDRVDRLMQETDGREPLTAYRVTFCPADNVALETGKRVVEAYAGALVDAGQCPACNRFFSDDTLTEIKLWEG